MALFEGIIPAVTTPFDATDQVDVPALKANVEAMIEAGVHGFVATGTMGEAGSLSSEERRTVVKAVVEASAGRVPVTVGVSSGSALASLAYALDAKALGATAIMSLPPLGYRADEDEVVAFFTELASGAGLPVMAYNNPEASGVDMPPELIVRIYEAVDGVVAIKECSGDVRRIPAIANATSDLEVLVGGDDWALEGFAAGATGWVTGVGVVAPAEVVELYDLLNAGDLPKARALYRRLLPVARFDMTPKLVQYFKAAQDAVGLNGGPTRPPRMPLTAAEREALEAALEILREHAHA
ncbi:dihydrodipicolinate synthase family protein [Candidatus Solirubrobacter pratensis]|uniref:dihydrodipicolinate synthase family protein n=1 Tax=Candidatus Solirubrobacter pratensis TaxID=1298857 RepID=UPI0004161BA1|nr:dihydrodipicolinate synthase family protein [Candidatus Solirubrobacter pratensis]